MTEESTNYFSNLDRILEAYENSAKNDKYFLLNTKYLAGRNYDTECGLSPSKDFSPVIVLYKKQDGTKIVFSIFEWKDIIE